MTVRIESVSAVTLAIADMERSVRFYRSLGFEVRSGGEKASFTTLAAGPNYVNLEHVDDDRTRTGWGRVIVYVSDVDAMHERAVGEGHLPEFEPRDAAWGERYFHLRDPDGHELSFARPL